MSDMHRTIGVGQRRCYQGSFKLFLHASPDFRFLADKDKYNLWKQELFVIIMTISRKDKHDHLTFVDLINKSMFLSNRTRPLPRTIA